MKVLHSPACHRLLSDWFGKPHDSVERRLANFAFGHTDIETRDLLLTIFDEDPADSGPVAAARELWPLLILGEPLHTLEDLRDELDTLNRDYELLRLRTQALAAKFRALEPWAEMWNRYPHEEPEFGVLNIDWTVGELRQAESMMSGYVAETLAKARGYATKLRVYDEAAEAVAS